MTDFPRPSAAYLAQLDADRARTEHSLDPLEQEEAEASPVVVLAALSEPARRRLTGDVLDRKAFNPAQPRDGHGRWGHGSGEELPPLTLIDVRSRSVEWMPSPDRQVRAVNLWADSYEGMGAIRAGMRNLDAGRPVLEGIELEDSRMDLRYTDTRSLRGGPTYKLPDLKADVASAAITMRQMRGTATPTLQPLYRGMRVSDPHLFKVGDPLDLDLSSASPNRETAQVYASESDRFRKGNAGVMMVFRPGSVAVNLDEGRLLGRFEGHGEHLVVGAHRVVAVSEQDGMTVVEVEAV